MSVDDPPNRLYELIQQLPEPHERECYLASVDRLVQARSHAGRQGDQQKVDKLSGQLLKEERELRERLRAEKERAAERRRANFRLAVAVLAPIFGSALGHLPLFR
jgi:hypothetical protein